MEGTGGGPSAVSPVIQWKTDASRLFQYYLDKTTPHPVYRWVGTLVVAAIYILRVYYVQGFYVISYGLGIYLLNLLIGFLSPLVDPELETPTDSLLPTKGSDEFKPFIRRLPEFKFWYEFLIVYFLFVFLPYFALGFHMSFPFQHVVPILHTSFYCGQC